MLVPTVVADARYFPVLTKTKISTAARSIGAIMSAVPADAYALSLGPCGNTRAYFIDDADDFVSGHAGDTQCRPLTSFVRTSL